MGTKLTPPTRREALVDNTGIPSHRTIHFLEDVSKEIEALPEQMANVTDVSGSSAANNQAKINEILAELINSGVMGA